MFQDARNSIAQNAALQRLLSLILSFALVGACLPLSLGASLADAAQGTLVIAIDPGHGADDSGACGNGVFERDANWSIASACVEELSTYEGVKVVLTQNNKQNLSQKQRVQSALDQGADAVVSIHCNSVDNAPSAKGAEVWVPNNSAYRNDVHVEGYNLGKHILENLVSLGLSDRGLKTRSTQQDTYPSPGGLCDYLGINYYARLNGIPGIIVEHAFVSNADDAAKLKDAEWLKKMGVADATGIAEYYGLVKKGQGAGSGGQGDSGNQGDAGGQGDSSSADMYRTGEPVVTQGASSYESDPAIMGSSKVEAEDLAAWYVSKGKTFPSSTYARYGASTIEQFCQIYCEEAAAEGVRAEVAFSQAMNETGWLKFGGQVKAGQCNFAGIGALDGGAAGADFSGYGENAVRMGVRAQIQHLKAYASTESLSNECVDPRFHLVTRGCAPTVGGLSGRWASSATYGQDLACLVNDLLGGVGGNDADAVAKVDLTDVPAGLVGTSAATVCVDGIAQTMSISGGFGTVPVSGEGTHVVTLCEYEGDPSSNPHAAYPVHLYIWIVKLDASACTTTRYYGFDDLLRYAGCSIRVAGNKGIRMITGISSQLKSALVGEGVLGYTVVETGTLIAWSDKVAAGGPTFATAGVSRGKAYVKGSRNPVLSTAGGVEYYTNVLVGFSAGDQCKRDLSMRPYAVLSDSAGNQFVVYGATVQRSIGYIAEQNADAFPKGTAAYEFVHGIIDACKD